MAKQDGHTKVDKNGDDADMVIDAMPTKMLFIDMLTRDIGLIPAIIDLVDNSADGARNMKADKSFKGLSVRLDVSADKFKISDNCGGMSEDTARYYAFRFGRPEKAPMIKHSVGQFGVGMKRALFKIGSNFHIESATKVSRFTVDIDVEKWATETKWEFAFKSLETDLNVDEEDRGTMIEVESLHPDVAEAFGSGSFQTQLKNELQTRLQEPISRGLYVTLNKLSITAEPLRLLESSKLAPAFKEITMKEKGKPVYVKLYCGLGRSPDPKQAREEAGWHVFCNGRLILEADKTEATGWGHDAGSVFIPGFHNQYNYLRGYAYFDCDDAGRLPWNTTKTGLNTDSAVYKATLLEMMKLMRPVVDFLNNLKDEKTGKDEDEDQGPYQKLLDAAKEVPLATVDTRSAFTVPTPKAKPANAGPVMQKIQYYRPLKQVTEVMNELGVSSYTKAGERTFDYFYKAECGK